MSNKLSKSVVFASGVLLVSASMVFAQAQPQPQQPGAGTSGTQQMQRQPMGTPPTGTMPQQQMGTQTGTMGMQDAMAATVTEVNQQQKTVKLQLKSGEMVEFKVPDQLLTDLNQGDSVQVSIRKAEGAGASTGTQGTGVRSSTVPPSRPEGGSVGQSGTDTSQPRPAR